MAQVKDKGKVFSDENSCGQWEVENYFYIDNGKPTENGKLLTKSGYDKDCGKLLT